MLQLAGIVVNLLLTPVCFYVNRGYEIKAPREAPRGAGSQILGKSMDYASTNPACKGRRMPWTRLKHDSIERLVRDFDLPEGTFRIALYLVTQAGYGPKNNIIPRSQAELARDLGMSRQRFHRYFRLLKQVGFVRQFRAPGSGWHCEIDRRFAEQGGRGDSPSSRAAVSAAASAKAVS